MAIGDVDPRPVPVEQAVEKARVLTEALGWIRRFRDRYVVIKLGGSALDDPQSVRSFLTDVIFMEAVGAKPILVHGGGKAISTAMQAAGLEARFVRGRRYTDDQTLQIAARVLAHDVCESIVAEIRSQGGRAVGLSHASQPVLMGRKLTLHDDDGSALDLGHVGEVCDIRRDILLATCRSDAIPVLPTIAVGSSGLLNVNADTAAAAVAEKLPADKLVFVSDVPGVMLDRHDPSTLQSHLNSRQCRDLIARGIIDAGMVPKVEAALAALESGVQKVHLVDARVPHSILLEVYSNQGIGTEIVL